jgi:hypothetical protein
MAVSLGILVIRSSLVDWRSMKKECRHARHSVFIVYLSMLSIVVLFVVQMRTLFYGVLCPLVASVGILGNILCLIVLSSPQFNDFMYIFLKVEAKPSKLFISKVLFLIMNLSKAHAIKYFHKNFPFFHMLLKVLLFVINLRNSQL